MRVFGNDKARNTPLRDHVSTVVLGWLIITLDGHFIMFGLALTSGILTLTRTLTSPTTSTLIVMHAHM